MTHCGEDDLLGYALETLVDDEERAKIAAHLATCLECRTRLEDLRKDIEIIGGLRLGQRTLRAPGPGPREVVTSTILRTAALVVLGILVGFGASRKIPREPELVSSAYVTLSPPTDSLTGYTVSDATDIPHDYYEQLLEH